jgi:hypothetical protein
MPICKHAASGKNASTHTIKRILRAIVSTA